MSEIWNFSPSVSDQVKLCIAAARIDEHNKWFQEFGHLSRNQNLCETFCVQKVVETSQVIDISSENNDAEDGADTKVNINRTSDLDVENIEEMVESLETEFSTRVNFVIEECSKTNNLLHRLALTLSANTLEKLCKHICDKEDISKELILQYMECFLLTFIKRYYNSITLDTLVQSHKRFPLHFKLFIQKLIKDTEVPKQVLKTFVESLNEDDRASFIVDLSELDLSPQEFSNSILSIYAAYKDCKKSERVQIYLQLLLIQHSSFCVTDRHYGKLLLTFLQTQKSLKLPINNADVENIVETHRSPFKRPCSLLLKEMLGENDVTKSTSEDDSE